MGQFPNTKAWRRVDYADDTLKHKLEAHPAVMGEVLLLEKELGVDVRKHHPAAYNLPDHIERWDYSDTPVDNWTLDIKDDPDIGERVTFYFTRDTTPSATN